MVINIVGWNVEEFSASEIRIVLSSKMIYIFRPAWLYLVDKYDL